MERKAQRRNGREIERKRESKRKQDNSNETSPEQCGQSGGDSIGNLRRASGQAGEQRRRRTGKGKKRNKCRVEKVGAGQHIPLDLIQFYSSCSTCQPTILLAAMSNPRVTAGSCTIFKADNGHKKITCFDNCQRPGSCLDPTHKYLSPYQVAISCQIA